MTNTSQTEKHEKENWRTNTNTAMRPRFKKPKRNKIIEKRKSERKKTPILKNIEKQFQCSWTSVVTHYQLLKLSQSENIKKIMCLFEKTHSKSKQKKQQKYNNHMISSMKQFSTEPKKALTRSTVSFLISSKISAIFFSS